MSCHILTRVVAILLTSFGFVTAANAAAPFQRNQSPGYYRLLLGTFEITALSDGSSPLPMKQMLTNITPGELTASLRDAFLQDPVETSVNAFLINTDTHLVLIDTGAGTLIGPRQGKLLANLRAAGYSPEQIDEVYITHMHGDHVGGLVIDGKLAFPNATVRASRLEADFWLNKKNQEAAPEALRGQFQAATSSLNPYIRAGKFKPFDGITTLVPGLTARPTPGHTPGHTVYIVENSGQKLIVLGDVVHIGGVQFADPSVTVQFDTDPKTAALTRKDLLTKVSADSDWLAGAHLSFPGIGHIRATGSGYTFIPVNYNGTP